MIRFACKSCGKSLKMPESAAGKKGKCPGCGEIIQVPAPAPETELHEAPRPTTPSSPKTHTSVPGDTAEPIEFDALCRHKGKEVGKAVMTFDDAGLKGINSKNNETFLSLSWSQIETIQRQRDKIMEHWVVVKTSEGQEVVMLLEQKEQADQLYHAVSESWPNMAEYVVTEASPKTKAMIQFGVAGIAAVIGIALYLVIANMEPGDSMRTNIVIVILYNWLGELGLLIIGLLVAVISAGLGVMNLLKKS